MSSAPMSDQQLEEIRLRDWKYRPSDLANLGMHPSVDRHALLAEVDRLRAELANRRVTA